MVLSPLEGYTVGITADRRSVEQAELLGRRGASVLLGPTMRTQYLGSEVELRRATTELVESPPDYLIATTGIGIRAWIESAATWGLGDALVEALSKARIITRGPKAAASVQAAGLPVWQRSATEQMDGVVAVLRREALAGCRVAIQEDGVERTDVAEAVTRMGAIAVPVPVYRWRMPDDHGPALRLVEAACEGRLDAITFTTAPSVHNLFAIAAAAGRKQELRRALNSRVVAACIGPVCAKGAKAEGIDAPIAPSVGRLGLLVRALSDHLESRRRTLRARGCDLVVQGSVVEVSGVKAELTPKERAAFEALARQPGAVVSRRALLERGWGSADTDPHLLDVTIARLRRRLGPCGAAIQSLPRRGYRLDAD